MQIAGAYINNLNAEELAQIVAKREFHPGE
jgi:hypothetical protein